MLEALIWILLKVKYCPSCKAGSKWVKMEDNRVEDIYKCSNCGASDNQMN